MSRVYTRCRTLPALPLALGLALPATACPPARGRSGEAASGRGRWVTGAQSLRPAAAGCQARRGCYPPAVVPAALVFDLDGTLVDSRPDLASAVNATRERLGLPPLSLAAVTGMVGEGARVLVRRALPESVAGAAFDEALALFLDLYFERCLEGTRAYPGIPEALAELAAGRPLAVLTNKPERHSRKVLAGLGLLPWFEAVVGGDTLPARKPDPAGLLSLAARWGLPPGEVLLVGDSAVDAATARAGGCRLALVEWGFADVGPLLAAGDLRVATPAGLVAALAARERGDD